MSWRAVAVLLLIAWGAAAFGGVYPWAAGPLFAGCALLGVASLTRPRIQTRRAEPPLAAALVLLIAAISAQLVPIPLAGLEWLSPETDSFLRNYELGYPHSAAAHPLSIHPRATALALAAALALSLLLLGLTSTLDRIAARHIVRGVVVIGVALALIGMAQGALWNGKIYGFWTPYEEGNPFGPFVNRNHFAGWMLMAIPLSVGYLCSRVAVSMPSVRSGWRERTIWLSSPEASEALLVAFGINIMAVGLMLTTSRTGILGLLIALLLSGWFAIRHQRGFYRRFITTGYMVLVVVLSVGWVGIGYVADRFAGSDAITIGNRLSAWNDTWRIITSYPLTGTGVNTYGTAMLFYQTEQGRHFLQAHNDYLQLLAEGGLLVGAPSVFLALTVAFVVRTRFRQSPRGSDNWTRMGAVVGVLAIALQEIVDFSLQIPGNAVLFCVLCAIAMAPSVDPLRSKGVALDDLR